MATPAERGVPLSTLCPKYLHSNSTSHTGPFSAIAELIDNAYDPDVSASCFWIDKTVVDGKDCLSFMDNGNGLDYEKMHKMLSFGYSDKTTVKKHQPIGFYGNGFKSGSMRLGKDAIVFSKSKTTSCVGMLSQTYLQEIGAKHIIVPIVCFEQTETNDFTVREDQKTSLQDILCHSPFKTQEDLLKEVNSFSSSGFPGKTGTRIIIWNIRSSEYDFEVNRYDIRIPSEVYQEMNETSYTPECVYSLRAYCSILYQKPRMKIMVRGKRVDAQLISKTLAFTKKDKYKPTFLSRPITITFGYCTKSKDVYGVMMYYKNRLIKPYVRVGCQLKTNYRGVGVVGVIECNFLEPTHNKQSFNETDQYRKTINSLGIKLEEYWKEIDYRRKTENPNDTIPVEDIKKRADQNWVQCDLCLKWRKLPDGIDPDTLPEKWMCHLNTDFQFRSCQAEEEQEDSEDEAPYSKTFRQQEREDKRRQKEKQKEEEDRKQQEMQRWKEENQKLKQDQQRLKRKLNRARASSSPRTPKGLPKTPRQAALDSPSSSSGLPVISEVWSESPLSVGETSPTVHQTTPRTPKRPRVSLFHETPTADISPQSSPSVLATNQDDDDETDDDISILESGCTPMLKKPTLDLDKVKPEPEQSLGDEDMLSATSNHTYPTVPMDVKVEEPTDMETCPAPASLPGMVSSSIQTGVRVKEEELSQSLTSEIVKEETAGHSGSNNHCSGVDCDEMKPQLGHAGDADISCVQRSPSRHSPTMIEAQEQQDQLLELMQATAQERDAYKLKVHELTLQLQEMQRRVQELSEIHVEKECSDQGCQTEETGDGKDFKGLLEKAKQKIHEIILDREEYLLTTPEPQPTPPTGEEEAVDEMVWQVGRLAHELDEKTKEADELRVKLTSLEEEKANLAAQWEEFQGDQEGTGGTVDADTNSSLVELRHNVGRLLVSHVPALDLGQVNYECNVIDEILEQYLCEKESDAPTGRMNGAINV